MAEINQNQGKAKRKRSANWDNIEKNLLKTCMKDFVPIIENKNTDTNTNKSKVVAWQTVTQRFNELNNRERHLLEIKQQWRTMKLDAKKNMSQVKISMNRTGGGPKPPSPSPETLEIISMIPQEFEVDCNVFDCDGISTDAQKQELEPQASTSSQEIVIKENANENLSPLSSITYKPTNTKPSGIKRKLPFSNHHSVARSTPNSNGPKHWDKEFAKERNQVLIDCITREHDVKMKNLIEVHRFSTEEHILKMKQMEESHALFKEESKLRIEKLKIELSLIQKN